MDPGITTDKKRSGTVSSVARETGEMLARHGVLFYFLTTFLLCLACSFAVYGFFSGVSAFLNLCRISETVWQTLDILLDSLFGVTAFLLLSPLWLGRLHSTGLFWQGDQPALREVFYYFTSAKRLGRSYAVSAIILLQMAVPIAIVVLSAHGVQTLCNEIFPSVMQGILLWFCLVLARLSVILIAALLFFLSGYTLLFAAFAVGDESSSIWRAFRTSCAVGFSEIRTVTLFALRSLGMFLLSLLTVGVLQVFYFTHFYILSYMRLSMTLCSKGETQ